MARPRVWPPRVTQRGGQDYTRIEGRYYPLGPRGSQEARQTYLRLVDEYERGVLGRDSGLTVAEGIIAFLKWADTTDHFTSDARQWYRHALRPLYELYADSPVKEFDTVKLKKLRSLLAERYALSSANGHFGRIRTFFRWLEEEKLAPPGLYGTLLTVRRIEPGGAREPDPIAPVPDDVILATLPHLNDVVRAAVQVQLLTAARPGEILGLRPCDLLRSGKHRDLLKGRTVDLDAAGVWAVKLKRHKTMRKGKSRFLIFGPQAQAILAPLLQHRSDECLIFDPVLAFIRDQISAKQLARLGGRYTTRTYRQAIEAGCRAAFPPPPKVGRTAEELAAWYREHYWQPNALRHSAATRIADEYGDEMAREILGHTKLSTTEIYALKNLNAAMEAMGEMG